MATALRGKNSEKTQHAIHPDVKGNFYVITAEWNSHVTFLLRDGADTCLKDAGVEPDRIKHILVPGTVELVNAAAMVMKKEDTSGVIVIGCVIRGDTPHFDYVCKIASEGVTSLNGRGEVPVIFGVLTVDNEQQALDRAGGIMGNKGYEAGEAAVIMANLHVSFPA